MTVRASETTGRRLGLVCLNNRYHDPITGQFISVDPLVASTGEPYIYGAANPISFSDPDGLDPDTSAWIRGRAEANDGCTYSSGLQCFLDKGSDSSDEAAFDILDWYNPGVSWYAEASAGYGPVGSFAGETGALFGWGGVADWSRDYSNASGSTAAICALFAAGGLPGAGGCAALAGVTSTVTGAVEVIALWADDDPSAGCRSAVYAAGAVLPSPSVVEDAVAGAVFEVSRWAFGTGASASC